MDRSPQESQVQPYHICECHIRWTLQKCSALLKENHLQTSSSKTFEAYGALTVKAYVPVAYKHPTS